MRTNRALEKQIIATYADVLFQAANADGAVDIVGAQLDDVLHWIHGHAEFRTALLDEELPVAGRIAILGAIFPELHPALSGALTVMLEQGNIDVLSAIAEAYANVAEENRGVAVAEVTTAVTLTDALRESIKSKLASDLGKEVVLREKVDPAIIGGIVIDAAGRRIDASIASQLEHTRLALSTTASVGGGV